MVILRPCPEASLILNKTVNVPLRVHVLVDLEWSPSSGGHVKCWERFAESAITRDDIDMTLHVAGEKPGRHDLAKHVRFEVHRPVFSTRKIPFLGHVPDHTDMGSYHPALAAGLMQADIIHTTDGFFNYAKTAERIAMLRKLPLTHSMHTDTIAYTELFTRSMMEKLGPVGTWLDSKLDVPKRAADSMEARLRKHIQSARAVLVSRNEDEELAKRSVDKERVGRYRLGLDFEKFNPQKRNPEVLRKRFGIPEDAFIVMFVGRLDEGKNIYTLLDAVAAARAEKVPVFLLAAGEGPARHVIKQKLGIHAATPGNVSPDDLATMYASADFLALPSEVETWSMAAAEALASALPIIASEKSGVARFIRDGGGVLVPDGSVASWKTALVEANQTKNHPTRRDAALAAAEFNFPTWDRAFAEDFMPVWRHIADTSFVPSPKHIA